MKPASIFVAAALVSGLAALGIQSSAQTHTVKISSGGAKFIALAAR